MSLKEWWHNANGKRSKDGTHKKWCIRSGKHKRMFRRGDTVRGQWECSKCGFAYGPIGIFDFGMVVKGKI